MQTTVSLCHAEAQQAIAAIQNELTRRGKATVIAVADAYGELIALLRMDGAPLPRTKHGQRHASASPRDPQAWFLCGVLRMASKQR